MGRPLLVLDIDGVLADVRHRLHHLAARPKDWDGFFAAAPDDDVLAVGAEFARKAAATHDVLYLTGRPERLRAATQTWLEQHALPPGVLVMRSNHDRRPSSAMKLQALRDLRRTAAVDLLVDDDPSVVTAARAAGFTVQQADWMPTPSRRRAAHSSDADTLFGSDLLHDAQEHEGQT